MAIAELVYLSLRRRAELLWRLDLAGAEAGPRTLVLATLALLQRTPPAEIESLFTGSGFAAPPLSAAERQLLAALAAPAPGSAPDWVQGAYPAWLESELHRRFGTDLLPEMQAMQPRAAVDLRVNLLRGTRTEAEAKLAAAGISAMPMSLSPLCLRLPDRAALATEPAYLEGLVEPQDEGSQVVALLLGAAPGMVVVDLCAGAGGKTLALAAAMGNRGRLIACDSDARRLSRLAPRATRAAATIIESHVLAPSGDSRLAALAGAADRVLLDVPCSGTGTWRRQPEARWRLSPADLARDLGLQSALLDQAAALLRPGGRLVYATCSLLPSENQDQVEAFLARRPDFRLEPLGPVWAETLGTPCPLPGPYLALTPRQHGTDGFFAAVLSRLETV